MVDGKTTRSGNSSSTSTPAPTTRWRSCSPRCIRRSISSPARPSTAMSRSSTAPTTRCACSIISGGRHSGLRRAVAAARARRFPDPAVGGRSRREDSTARPCRCRQPRSAKAPTGAVEFLIETYRNATDEIALVPVAPLTNIAAALAALSEARRAGAGGRRSWAAATRSATSRPSAEFNIWADPEAAAVVFAAGFRKITLVPLDATHRALVSRDDCARLRALGTPAGQADGRHSPATASPRTTSRSGCRSPAPRRCTTRSASPR